MADDIEDIEESEESEEQEEQEEQEEREEREPPRETAVPANDAFTGMLAISLIALIIGSVLLFLDYNQYSGKTPNPSALSPMPAAKKDGAAPPPVEKKDEK
jgi:hypothetical protein